MAEVKWIKICTDIFDDEKILLIEDMPEADAIIVIWFKLLCMAGKQNNDGVFLMNDKVAYTDEMLSAVFRRPLNTVRLALKTFEAYGMIEIINDTITIPNWEKHQNSAALRKRKEDTRRRVAAYRKRQKALLDHTEEEEVMLGRSLPSKTNCEEDMESETIPAAQKGVTRYKRVTNAYVTPPDEDVDEEGDKETSTATAGYEIPDLDGVIRYFGAAGLSVDPKRFFEINNRRGWVTKSGKPVDDWRALARKWNEHERPSKTPDASKRAQANQKDTPTAEELMESHHVTRDLAERMLREDLY